MYTISKGPAQIVEKTRIGIAQKLDSMDAIRDLKMSKKNSSKQYNQNIDSNNHIISSSSSSHPSPQIPTFKYSKKPSHRINSEPVSCEEKEVLKYISENWNSVQRELEYDKKNGSSKVIYYQETHPNPMLRNFEPFDLESWWGKKLYYKLTHSETASSDEKK